MQTVPQVAVFSHSNSAGAGWFNCPSEIACKPMSKPNHLKNRLRAFIRAHDAMCLLCVHIIFENGAFSA